MNEVTDNSDNVAAVQRVSGEPVTVLRRETTGQQAKGMHMLDLAAKASLATSYQGTELVSQSDVGCSVEVVSQVWHEGGGARCGRGRRRGRGSRAVMPR